MSDLSGKSILSGRHYVKLPKRRNREDEELLVQAIGEVMKETKVETLRDFKTKKAADKVSQAIRDRLALLRETRVTI